MRTIPLLLSLLVLGGAAGAEEVTFESLSQDPGRRKVLDQGVKLIRKWYELETKIEKGDLNAIAKRGPALLAFRKWMDASQTELGVDVRQHADLVLEIIDRGKIAVLARYKKGQIEYVQRPAKGFGRGQFEYSVLVPRSYEPKEERIPLVVSLHGRAIDPKHPAFRNKANYFAQRSRKTIWDNWYKKPAGENVVVIAPTGTPDGFKYEATKHEDRQYDDRHALFLAVGRGLTDYRTDWNRVFAEVHGTAVRLLLEQPLLFAGLIVRDREDARSPILEPEEYYLLENLNGTPFCYIADERLWDTVGKPVADALTQAYAKAGKRNNLIVMKVARDANGALLADQQQLATFVTEHRLPDHREKIAWRFPNPNFTSPTPLEISGANFALRISEEARKQPMEALAGHMLLRVTRENAGDTLVNKIDIQITEAESVVMFLHDHFVNLDLPVTVVVNGTVVKDKVKVERDWGFFMENILPRTFFMIPAVARLECEFAHKPQFVPPAPPQQPVSPPDETGAGPK